MSIVKFTIPVIEATLSDADLVGFEKENTQVSLTAFSDLLADVNMPLKTNFFHDGYSLPIFYRNPAYTESTLKDHKGRMHHAEPNEARFEGVRRVVNWLYGYSEYFDSGHWIENGSGTHTDNGDGTCTVNFGATGGSGFYNTGRTFYRNIQEGDWLVQTVEMKATSGNSGKVYLQDPVGTAPQSKNLTEVDVVDTEWKRYTHTTRITSGTQTAAGVWVRRSNDAGRSDEVMFRKPQIEIIQPGDEPIPSEYVSVGAGGGMEMWREQASTFETGNTIINGEDFSSNWGFVGMSISVDQSSSPDGRTTADKMVEDSANSQHYMAQPFTATANEELVVGCFIKTADRFRTGIGIWNVTDTMIAQGWLRMDDGFTTNNVGETYFEYVGNGWWWMACRATPTVAANNYILVYVLDDSGNVTYLGDGSSGLYVWGAVAKHGTGNTDDMTPDIYIPSVDTYSWNENSTHTIENDNGVLKANPTTAGSNLIAFDYLREADEATSDLEVGREYKLTFQLKQSYFYE